MPKRSKVGWGVAETRDGWTVHFFSPDGRSLCGRAEGERGVPWDLQEVQRELTCRRCEALCQKAVNGGKSE